jgi:hypothetical protein
MRDLPYINFSSVLLYCRPFNQNQLPFNMSKNDWKFFWGLFRKRNGWNNVRYHSKDIALICTEVLINRNSDDPLVCRAKNRRSILDYARNMGRSAFYVNLIENSRQSREQHLLANA